MKFSELSEHVKQRVLDLVKQRNDAVALYTRFTPALRLLYTCGTSRCSGACWTSSRFKIA